jgi:hypothetical protein
MEKEKLDLLFSQFSRRNLNEGQSTSVLDFNLLNEFLGYGMPFCSKQIKNQVADDDFLCGWLIWWEPNKIEKKYQDLLVDLIWVSFEKEMEITTWHPWDGQFSPAVVMPNFWAKGYFRYLYRTRDIQGINTVLSCTLGYNSSVEFFTALSEVLGPQKFLTLVFHFMNQSKSEISCTEDEFVSKYMSISVLEVIDVVSEMVGSKIEETGDCFSLWFSD